MAARQTAITTITTERQATIILEKNCNTVQKREKERERERERETNCGRGWKKGGTNPKKVAGGAAGDTAGERRRVADEKKFMFLTVSSLPCHKQTTPTYTHTHRVTH